MEIPIVLSTDILKPTDVKEYLESSPGWSGSNTLLELRSFSDPERLVFETAVLVALVGAASAGITALITGLLSMAQQKNGMYIELHDKDGRILKIPAETSNEQLEQLINKMKRMEINRIEVVSPE